MKPPPTPEQLQFASNLQLTLAQRARELCCNICRHCEAANWCPFCARILAALREVERNNREIVAQWMMANGFATGHGETIQDLLAELKWQVDLMSQGDKFGIVAIPGKRGD
jgi:hypothetical protein